MEGSWKHSTLGLAFLLIIIMSFFFVCMGFAVLVRAPEAYVMITDKTFIMVAFIAFGGIVVAIYSAFLTQYGTIKEPKPNTITVTDTTKTQESMDNIKKAILPEVMEEKTVYSEEDDLSLTKSNAIDTTN